MRLLLYREVCNALISGQGPVSLISGQEPVALSWRSGQNANLPATGGLGWLQKRGNRVRFPNSTKCGSFVGCSFRSMFAERTTWWERPNNRMFYSRLHTLTAPGNAGALLLWLRVATARD